MLINVVEKDLHCQTRVLQAIGDPNGVETVATANLITSTFWVGIDIATDKCNSVLGVGWIGLQVVVMLGLVGQARTIDRALRRLSHRRVCRRRRRGGCGCTGGNRTAIQSIKR